MEKEVDKKLCLYLFNERMRFRATSFPGLLAFLVGLGFMLRVKNSKYISSALMFENTNYCSCMMYHPTF